MKRFIQFMVVMVLAFNATAKTKTIQTFKGIAKADVASYKDPAFKDKNFKKILVSSTFADLSIKQTTEETFVKELKVRNIEAVCAINIIAPTRKYTSDEIKAILKDNGIDGVLFVNPVEDNQDKQSYSTQCFAYSDRGVNCSTSSVSNSKYFTRKFKIVLTDSATDANAWLYDFDLIGGISYPTISESARYQKFLNIMAKDAVDTLADEKLIVVPERKK